MRTNIVLDDELIAEAMRLTGARTKREIVHLALQELIGRYRQRQLKRLKGKDLIDPDYDVRAVRRAMSRDAG
ncbi:MAG TPA: type II toxin-antitoxin system VapB family antitoxin [Thiolapillus brandeum]|uniref:Type II toxin-antitoxin system VapB family antitoxin n=1 Tax=Thiolapillus brandeum TaxID=1076588 RepID=A0A7C5IYD4_9GAMM|nr:type II toxin-antitoxin system VapB family antitoxin [Thiolapillus brandeum]